MIVEFGYYDSFGKLAPICATKDSLFDSSVITTYISTLNEINIVRLVLDDLKPITDRDTYTYYLALAYRYGFGYKKDIDDK